MFAAAALLLCSAPALAATGNQGLCKKLTLETVDLAASGLDPSSRIDSDTLEAAGSGSAANPLTPKAETILREIFDEAVAEDQETDEPAAITSPNAAPIAELTAPVIREQTRDIDASDAAEADAESESIDARVPGLSDEQLLRYRRQMYRTDI